MLSDLGETFMSSWRQASELKNIGFSLMLRPCRISLLGTAYIVVVKYIQQTVV